LRALVCRDFGPLDTLRVERVEPAPLAEGQLRIAVAACGINFPDVLLVQGLYQVKPPLPFFPGGEVSGTVQELGPGVSGFEIGQAVMATIYWGGLAEFATAPAAAVLPVPPGMNLHSAAVFQGGHTTVYHALVQRAALRRGETLLVLGAAGGVGMAAMQIGRALGARVIGAAGSARKVDALRVAGYGDVINYSDGNLREQLRSLAGPQGVDVILDPVGGDLFDQACRCVRSGSRVLVVGFASGRIPQYPANIALLKESALIGVNYQQFHAREPDLARRNFAELARLYADGLIAPHIDRVFSLTDAASALAAMADRSVIGKILVAVRP